MKIFLHVVAVFIAIAVTVYGNVITANAYTGSGNASNPVTLSTLQVGDAIQPEYYILNDTDCDVTLYFYKCNDDSAVICTDTVIKGWQKLIFALTEMDGDAVCFLTEKTESAYLFYVHCGITLQNGLSPTCTDDGYLPYYKCACGLFFQDENCHTMIGDANALNVWKLSVGKLLATDHSYEFSYVWDDGFALCTAYGVCKCGNNYSETALATIENGVYVARFCKDGFITQTKPCYKEDKSSSTPRKLPVYFIPVCVITVGTVSVLIYFSIRKRK